MDEVSKWLENDLSLGECLKLWFNPVALGLLKLFLHGSLLLSSTSSHTLLVLHLSLALLLWFSLPRASSDLVFFKQPLSPLLLLKCTLLWWLIFFVNLAQFRITSEGISTTIVQIRYTRGRACERLSYWVDSSGKIHPNVGSTMVWALDWMNCERRAAE